MALFQQINETPALGADGVTLTLLFTPADASRIQLYVDGVRYSLGVHYTASGTTLTLLPAYALDVATQHTILADYEWSPSSSSSSGAAAPAAPAATGSIATIQTHTADAQARLIAQYADKPGMKALVAFVADRAQLLENTLYALLAGRALKTSAGSMLDRVGGIIGLQRGTVPGGGNDNVYRAWAGAQIRVNQSSGTVNNIIALYQATAAPNTVISVRPSGTATVLVVLSGAAQTVGPTLVSLLGAVKAAGVNPSVDYLATLPAFAFDGAGSGFDTGYFGGSV